VEVVLNKVIQLGRVDPKANIFPDVDLTDDGLPAQTVSRRHAGIFKQKGNLVVEDLGSVNGTFINGKRLSPYLPELLSDGDILQLGRLVINVSTRAR
jgi:pSer/pThr/pTyr-binding forkhead associated (FHA) protein